jgi:RHS repeat-associated protein
MRHLLGTLLLCLAGTVSAAPTVSLTAPAAGNLYLAPSTFAVRANASASGVGVNRVEFYANGVLIQTDTTSPYQFDWTNVAAGTYAITAKAIDNNGAETTSAARTVTVAATNTPPTVTLSAPADNARYLNPTSVTLSANAAGPELNDILQKVDFFLNGTLAQTITQAPFSYAATGLAPGTYTLTAVATDSQGAQNTSAPRTFTVSGTNVPPTVSLVTPQDNSRWNAPATVTFQASVNSGEANDTVSVEFFANGSSLGTRSSTPFSLSTNLTAATYIVTAVATDGQGAQTTSAARTIVVSDTNAAPTISITAPAADANFPTAPASFTINATAGAGEINGSVQRVEFYVNGSLVNTDTAGPFSFNVSGLANGTYILTAKAVDQLNAETVSAPITVTVGAAPLKLYFIDTDQLNTPRLVADATGTTVWRWDQQEPFGVNVPDENPSGFGAFDLPLRLPGQYYDREINLHYNMNRDYDPSLGIYKQSDPIGLRGGLNTYAYVLDNPLSYVDLLGLDVTVCYYSDAAAGFGHIGFGAGSEQGTSGYYPTGNPFGSPGEVKKDEQPTKECKVLPANPEQDDCMLKCRAERASNPGTYQLNTNQCTNFVRECLIKCGLSAGSSIGSAPRPLFLKLPGKAK